QTIALSRAFGDNIPFAEKNFEQAKLAAAAPSDEDFQALNKNFPATAAFLKDDQNMAVAKDDIPNLAQHEGLFDLASGAYNAEKDAFQRGALQEERDFLGWQKLAGETPGGLDPDLRASRLISWGMGIRAADPDDRISQIDARLAEINQRNPAQPFSFKDLPKRSALGFTGFLPSMMGMAGYGLKGAVAGAGTAAALGAETGPLDAPIALAGADMGANMGVAQYFFKQTAGSQYNALKSLRDENGLEMPDGTAKIAALATGAASAGLSAVTVMPLLQKAMRAVPGGTDFMTKFMASAGDDALKTNVGFRQALTNFTGAFLKDSGHAAAGMAGFQALSLAGSEGAKAASGQPFQRVGARDAAGQILKSGVEGAIALAPLAGFGGIPALGADLRDAGVAERSKQFYMALGDVAKDSKLRARLPEAYQAHVDTLTKNGPVQEIGIPVEAAERYFQSKNIDPAGAFEQLGVSDSYNEAKETGGDVRIPLAAWTAKMPPEHYAGLADDVRLFQDQLTPNEVKDRQAAVSEQMSSEDAHAQDRIKNDAQARSGYDMVYNDVKAQLADVERPAAFKTDKAWSDAIDKSAKLWASRMVTSADRRGMSVEDRYNEARVGVTDLDQDAYGEAEHAHNDRAQQEILADERGISPVMDAIRKYGGIDWNKVKDSGMAGELKDLNWTGIFKKGGATLDDMANNLSQDQEGGRVMNERDLYAMIDKINEEAAAIGAFKAKNGEKAYQRLRSKLFQEQVPEDRSAEGRQPGADGEPRPQDDKALEQKPQGRRGPGQRPGDEADRALFPRGSESLPSSVTGHPDYVKVMADAGAVVREHAADRGVEPTPELARQLWEEMHNELGRVRLAPTLPERRR
ncbi:MAG TPA: hypothetical protein VH309_07915, partial [Elusimicrobiota bacterium]|nr:hypothetical protein [Elusimicrobiota bacterium]